MANKTINDLFTSSPVQRKLPFVWELDYNGVKSLLVGTRHFAPNCFGDDVQRRVESVNTVLTEIGDPDLINYDDVAKQLSNLVRIADIFDCLSIKEKESCSTLLGITEETHYEKLCSVSLSGSLRKVALLPVLFVEIHLHKKAHPYFTSLEDQFTRIAKNKSIPVKALETVAEQLSVLEHSSFDEQVVYFKTFLAKCKTFEEWKKAHEKYIRAYVFGDSEYIKIRCSELPGVDIHIKRNYNLATRSLPYLNSPTIVAVGAAHCILEPSMIKVYEQQGVKTKRIE